jgi:hypothetical protein
MRCGDGPVAVLVTEGTAMTKRRDQKDELTLLAEDVVNAATQYLVTGVGPMYPAIDRLAAHLGMREPSKLPKSPVGWRRW